MSENLVEVIVTKNRQLYPKSNHEDGKYGIVSCSVEKVIQGEDILQIHPTYKTITIKGLMPNMRNREKYRVIGTQEYDTGYNTYSINIGHMDSYSEKLSKEDFDNYLQYVMTKAEFKKISKLPNIKEILDKGDTKSLMEVKGIGEKKAIKIIEKYTTNREENINRAKLAQYGMSEAFMNKLRERYNSYDVVLKKISENIYILAEDVVHGLGFASIDKLALDNSMNPKDPRRIRAFIIHLLKEGLSNGKSYLSSSYVLSSIYEDIFNNEVTMPKEELGEIFNDLFDSGVVWRSEDKLRLALTHAREIEEKIAKNILRLSNSKPKVSVSNWQETVKEIEKEQGWEYTQQQKQAIQIVLSNNFIVITGYAGTGKSTTLKPMTNTLVEKQHQKLSQCALSGKAANRIEEVTQYEAKTIHRLLGYNPNDGFIHGPTNPLDTDIVVIDEASMIDANLFLKLLQGIKTGTKVIVLGDIGQLPCIGQGALLLDMIESKKIPCVQLDIIHRQAKASGIVSASADVRQCNSLTPYNFEGKMVLGELKDLLLDITSQKEDLEKKVVEHFMEEYKKVNDIMEVGVVTATVSRGSLSSFNLNKLIKQAYNPIDMSKEFVEVSFDKYNKYYLSVGDKILITKNNYKAKIYNENKKEFEDGAIFNGNLGIVTKININSLEADIKGIGKVLIESKDYGTLQLGYACTCHKLQGGQMKSIIIAIDMSAYMLLSVEWLYTALTRAEKSCIVVSEPQAIHRGCTNRQGNTKTTFLREFLMQSKI